MWRFMFVCFAFLGWAFYELSGGSDYAPGQNSLQVHAEKERQRKAEEAKQAETEEAARAAEEAISKIAAAEKAVEQDDAGRVTLTLATVSTDATKAEILTRQDPETEAQPAVAAPVVEEAAIAAALQEVLATDEPVADQPEAGATDYRWVSANLVNLREGPGLTFRTVTQITKGTEVAVLEEPGHGWVNVRIPDTGESGWMADWLLTEPN